MFLLDTGNFSTRSYIAKAPAHVKTRAFHFERFMPERSGDSSLKVAAAKSSSFLRFPSRCYVKHPSAPPPSTPILTTWVVLVLILLQQ